jgi:sialic acid synthase SpsE
MDKNKVIIIADACQNHKGDLKILKEMIYAAKEVGADFIKIQSMLADELTYREKFEQGLVENGRAKAIKRPYQPEYERLKPMDLDDRSHAWFVDECKKAGIKPLTTVFSFSRIKFLATLDWDTIKVASYDCASFPFIKELSKYFKRLIISTGAAFNDEISQTAEILKGHSFSFLHCVTIYPTPLEDINLRRINWLRKFTSSVGFSDHTLVERDGIKASLAAVYFGADIIERHFTILKPGETKDGPVSITPKHLKELVAFIQLSKSEQKAYIDENVPEYSLMLGSDDRQLTDIEMLNRDYYRGRFAQKKSAKVIYNWEENING